MRVLLDTRARQWVQNPYIWCLAHSDDSVEFRAFSWTRALVGRYDVLHLHWPEYLLRQPSAVRAAIASVLFRLLLLRLRLQKITAVRTLHNLKPHEGDSPGERTLLHALARRCQLKILLNPTVLDEFPSALVREIPHGDYKPWLAHIGVEAPRGALPVTSSGPVRLLSFGILRRYKQVPRLIRALDDCEASAELTVAGPAPDSEYLDELRSVAAAAQVDVVLRPGRISEGGLVDKIKDTNFVVALYDDLHNSGVILYALSLNRPVIATRTPATIALAAEVGNGWLRLVTVDSGGVDRGDLQAALREPVPADQPNLTRRDWASIGRQHAHAYAAAMHARGSVSA
jgi:beta-1,4-mannosyltransferase